MAAAVAAVILAAAVAAAALAMPHLLRTAASTASQNTPGGQSKGTGRSAGGRTAPARPAVGAIGTYAVGSTSLVFTDRSRPYLGVRALPTLVRYPVVPASQVAAGKVSRGPFPLVVFAPGYLQCRSSYSALLQSWASAGYVVAAVEFARTRCGAPYPEEDDVTNQPADLSAVITGMIRTSASPDAVLSGMVDPARVGVAGHSDGGDDAAAVAANTCCRDPRVKAAVVLSGAEWPGLAGRFFAGGAPPMLFVQGTEDTWNPPSASMRLYLSDTSGIRYYLQLPGSGHFAPYEGSASPEPLVARATVAFLDAYLGGQRDQVRKLFAAADVRGVAVLETAGRLPS